MVQDGDRIADTLDVAQDVRGHTNCRSAAQAGNGSQDLMPARRIERAGWLVEEEHLRAVDERLGKAEPLAHAAGVATNTTTGCVG